MYVYTHNYVFSNQTNPVGLWKASQLILQTDLS